MTRTKVATTACVVPDPQEENSTTLEREYNLLILVLVPPPKCRCGFENEGGRIYNQPLHAHRPGIYL